MIATLRVQPDSTVIHSSTIKVTPDAMGAKCQCLHGTVAQPQELAPRPDALIRRMAI